MTNQSIPSGTVPELGRQPQFTPHRLALMATWLLTTAILVAMLASGVRDSGQFSAERNLLQVAYVAVLLWYLGKTGSSVDELPDIRPLLLPGTRIGPLIPVLFIALVFITVFIGDEEILLL